MFSRLLKRAARLAYFSNLHREVEIWLFDGTGLRCDKPLSQYLQGTAFECSFSIGSSFGVLLLLLRLLLSSLQDSPTEFLWILYWRRRSFMASISWQNLYWTSCNRTSPLYWSNWADFISIKIYILKVGGYSVAIIIVRISLKHLFTSLVVFT